MIIEIDNGSLHVHPERIFLLYKRSLAVLVFVFMFWVRQSLYDFLCKRLISLNPANEMSSLKTRGLKVHNFKSNRSPIKKLVFQTFIVKP